MSTLILVEHDNQHMHPGTRQLLKAALSFDAPITCLVAGHGCEGVAEEVAVLAGVNRVMLADKPCYAHPLAETISALLVALAEPYTVILAPATTFGKNCLPRAAALLDCCQISDVVSIQAPDTFAHPIYAGSALETVKVLDSKKILTIRLTAFDAVTDAQPKVAIERVDLAEEASTVFVSHALSPTVRPSLAAATRVVSGGRALESAEKFKLIETLADALGAAVGASRAAVDAGYVPNDYQVGQTGKVVAPELYIAVGISGAIQHLAGMKDSKVIVAINKDAEAPIFQIATYGLVGDLFELVPQLIARLKNNQECS